MVRHATEGSAEQTHSENGGLAQLTYAVVIFCHWHDDFSSPTDLPGFSVVSLVIPPSPLISAVKNKNKPVQQTEST